MALEYRHFQTADGSPTLCLPPTWERMHPEEGAFTERQLNYQPLVENAFESVREPVLISLGLGLGYNELLIAFEGLKRGKEPKLLASYESVDFLRSDFAGWLKGAAVGLSPVYDQIAALYSAKYKRDGGEAREYLLKLLRAGRLTLEGPIEQADLPAAHGILFDAFSPKTSPELWTPEFLDGFFARAAAFPCYVATHACNGVLKQALKKNGFTLDIRPGFGRKRESLSAHRFAEFKPGK